MEIGLPAFKTSIRQSWGRGAVGSSVVDLRLAGSHEGDGRGAYFRGLAARREGQRLRGLTFGLFGSFRGFLPSRHQVAQLRGFDRAAPPVDRGTELPESAHL